MIAFTDRDILETPDKWLRASIKASSNAGYSNLIALDSQVYSFQPDGSIQFRPAGTDGPYEQVKIKGDNIISDYNLIYVYRKVDL